MFNQELDVMQASVAYTANCAATTVLHILRHVIRASSHSCISYYVNMHSVCMLTEADV